MARLIFLGLLLFLPYISAEFSEWQTREVDLCAGPLVIKCPSLWEDLIIRKATYRPGECSCPPCSRGTLWKLPALDDIKAQCAINSSCTAKLNPYRTLKCNCLRKFLDVEYRCINRDLFQSACGDRDTFRFKPSGHIINHKYPEAVRARDCSIVFKVGDVKITTIKQWQMSIPGRWEAMYCNYSTCHHLESESQDDYQLIGDSFIRIKSIDRDTGGTTELELKFHFEYEVHHLPTVPSLGYDGTKYSRKEIGVLRIDKKTNVAVVVAATLGSIMLLAGMIATGFICWKRFREQQAEEKKILEETQQNMYFADEYQNRKSSVVGFHSYRGKKPMRRFSENGETDT